MRITPLSPVLAFVLLLGLTVFAGWFYQRGGGNPVAAAMPTETLVIIDKTDKPHRFEVEVARTPVDIAVGLMYRKTLPENGGMLFEISQKPAVTSFWMKNTLIPLDMLFVNEKGKIVRIHENVPPLSLEPRSSGDPVIAVIELRGGTTKRLGITTGDRVEHVYFKPSAAP